MMAEVAGTVAAEAVVTPVDELGEVGDESFLADTFFSLARLFWNHTFSSNMMRSDIPVSRRGRKGNVNKEMGKTTVKKNRKSKDSATWAVEFAAELSKVCGLLPACSELGARSTLHSLAIRLYCTVPHGVLRHALVVPGRISDIVVVILYILVGGWFFFFFFGIDYRAPRGTEPHVALLICMLHA